ncbi:MAG TPA: hypothetical protein PKW61_00145 [Tenuifilaceae bacterium]|nr:hypothetical protein [Tenuifilaceae bacterium]
MKNSTVNSSALDDNSPMPYGIFKNKPLGAVPPKYLLNLYESNKLDRKVKNYVKENFLALLAQVEQLKFNRKLKFENSQEV